MLHGEMRIVYFIVRFLALRFPKARHAYLSFRESKKEPGRKGVDLWNSPPELAFRRWFFIATGFLIAVAGYGALGYFTHINPEYYRLFDALNTGYAYFIMACLGIVILTALRHPITNRAIEPHWAPLPFLVFVMFIFSAVKSTAVVGWSTMSWRDLDTHLWVEYFWLPQRISKDVVFVSISKNEREKSLILSVRVDRVLTEGGPEALFPFEGYTQSWCGKLRHLLSGPAQTAVFRNEDTTGRIAELRLEGGDCN